jgi:DNA mismatch repair protein MutS2
MNQRHLDKLEFPKILAQLATHTSFSAGREKAESLRPTDLLPEAKQWQQETYEARLLLQESDRVSLGGVHDVRPQVTGATRGATLSPIDLLDIASTLQAGGRLRRNLTRQADRFPYLADIAARIEPCASLVAEIGRCLSENGEVLDQASERLNRIRRDLRLAHDRLMDRLNGIITSPRYAPFLQEALVTLRSRRYVVPVKAERKGQLQGIVHDTSASGATVFVEPLAVVELGNRWRELQIEEEKEVQRILAELSDRVARQGEAIRWTVEALADLDLAFAKGRYAAAIDATRPELVAFRKPARSSDTGHHPGSTLQLRQARHPLLDPEGVVPIDVHISNEFFVLVITGPNTGGKTVSLKTVGLMCAMAQAGLQIPAAEGSALSAFDGVYADIGDEQSIEQSLSTFSAHLNNIIAILQQATSHSLVLLDELGAGTDPVEGSALARALLDYLLARRISTLVATHYSELKVYAHATPGVANACVEFDLATLSPTYQLTIGLPGQSNAFAIAERLGLSRPIVQAARAMVAPESLEAETLLSEIKQAREEAVSARDAARVAQHQAEQHEIQLAARLVTIEAERHAILAEARAQARREAEALQAALNALRAELEEQRRTPSVVETWLAEAEAQLEAVEKATAPPPKPRPPAKAQAPSGPVAVGDTVYVEGLGTTGQLLTLDDESAEVQVGSFRVRTHVEDLELRSRAADIEEEKPQPSAPRIVTSSPGVELDLRGLRVDEVLSRLDKYLDDAFLAGLHLVRIIHGKGTGALQQAVRQELTSHPLVKRYRSGEHGEGGSGVTVAYLLDQG